jgi:hypothetical protein
LPGGLRGCGPLERRLDDLAWCRLHVAVQWLGWSETWSPPKHHAHDWLAELGQLAEAVAL